MTPIISTVSFGLTLAGYAAAVPSALVSPPLIWETVAVWALVAALFAALAGIVAGARRASTAETNHTAPARPTLATICPAGAH